jgi:hypothetical protein
LAQEERISLGDGKGCSKVSGQKIVCVLGMHRSGTSVFTRLLNLLGVDLGADALLTTEPVAANPKGYWENKELTAINDAILSRYHGSWDAPPLFKQNWQRDRRLDDLRLRANALINDQFSVREVWGWKDPRTCLTLPFWQALIGEMRYVVCLRDPLSVASSLTRRDGFGLEKSLSLWLMYVTSALKYTQGKSRRLVFYQELIDDPERSLARLGEFAGLEVPANAVRSAREFVVPQLQHHREETLLSGSELESCAESLYRTLRDGELPDDHRIMEIEQLLHKPKNSRFNFLSLWKAGR